MWKLPCTIEGVERVQCVTSNISRTGVLLKTSKVLLLGEALRLTIDFPNRPVTVAGKVRRLSANPRGVGVQFDQPSEVIHQLLWGEHEH